MEMIMENAKCVENNVNSMDYIRDIENDVPMLVWGKANTVTVTRPANVLYVVPTSKYIKTEKRQLVPMNVY